MFLDNRYTKIYKTIVTRSAIRGKNKQDHADYLERHHIIPKAMGGSDDASNLVLLTAREHFLCHLLLTRMTKGKDLIRMKHAFSYMALCHSSSHQRVKANSKWYEVARKMASQQRDPEWCENISKARKGQIPSAKSVAEMVATLTGRKLSDDHRAKLSKPKSLTSQAREARLETLVRSYHVTTTEEELDVINLKEWCRANGFNYSTAHNNTRCKGPVKSGLLRGYKFRLNEL